MNYIIYYHYRSDCHIKLSVVSAVAVKKIYLKSFNNLTSLSMGKPFFSEFGSVKKTILGHYRYLKFSKLSFSFLRMMNKMQLDVNAQIKVIWTLLVWFSGSKPQKIAKNISPLTVLMLRL